MSAGSAASRWLRAIGFAQRRVRGSHDELREEPVPPSEVEDARREGEERSMGTIEGSAVHKVVIACDAGMGSSAMVAAQLAGRLKPYDVKVSHASVGDIPADADLILCQETLLERARREDTGSAVILGFRSFLGDPVFDEVEQAVREGGPLGEGGNRGR
ncbi:hypothetical protein GCM10027271_23120 [Saccharopolyspora gloriosae]|uniref:Mannitol-specific phosphotransferase system IIBC component n=1 Tax=Saccharopolyspora gloriosae TaxID=455344 RepID=A0A840NRY4_9PSEU|nr:hypothetical protein [Saccharopolyspora gloriosae]MBB5070977.1 mannitol-specific phosphotransferase system IIBC component [Saccharopolyspora gloriosae]